MDDTRKRIIKYAFSIDNALIWMGSYNGPARNIEQGLFKIMRGKQSGSWKMANSTTDGDTVPFILLPIRELTEYSYRLLPFRWKSITSVQAESSAGWSFGDQFCQECSVLRRSDVLANFIPPERKGRFFCENTRSTSTTAQVF